MHTGYEMQDDVTKRLRKPACSLEEFMTTILAHVGKRHKQINRMMSQLTCRLNSGYHSYHFSLPLFTRASMSIIDIL